MKKIYQFLALLFFIFSFAQTPQKMSFQAVLRDTSNNPVQNKQVNLTISILRDSPTGWAKYIESHTATTNSMGLVTLELGSGIRVFGIFNTIDWSTGDHFLRVETSIDGGVTYTLTSNTQILSVPYALYAKDAKDAEVAKVANTLVNFDSEENVPLRYVEDGVYVLESTLRNTWQFDTMNNNFRVPKSGKYLIFFKTYIERSGGSGALNPDHKGYTELFDLSSSTPIYSALTAKQVQEPNALTLNVEQVPNPERMIVANLTEGHILTFRHMVKTFFPVSERPEISNTPWKVLFHNFQCIRIGD